MCMHWNWHVSHLHNQITLFSEVVFRDKIPIKSSLHCFVPQAKWRRCLRTRKADSQRSWLTQGFAVTGARTKIPHPASSRYALIYTFPCPLVCRDKLPLSKIIDDWFTNDQWYARVCRFPSQPPTHPLLYEDYLLEISDDSRLKDYCIDNFPPTRLKM